MAKSAFDDFLQEEVRKQKGVAFPVKASIFERLTVKEASCDKLHPNPEDEFTFPNIGPNYEIVSNYEKMIINNVRRKLPPFEEPIMVEKLHPHGYLILNGHHRWAAAMRLKVKKIPVKVINLAQESDIQKILENSEHDKRATLDLDEVVYRPEDAPFLEKKLGFPYSLKHKKRIRLGIPALFYNLSKNGYDIWLYSSNYESVDDVRDYFRCYGVHVDGIITGMAKDKKNAAARKSEVEKLMANKYAVTLHLDNDMILRTQKKTGTFQEFPLDPGENWSKEAIAAIGELEKNEKGSGSE
ncbi:MAG: ParB-like nuclease domain-containing protein [Lachnospiraceae bacterium]|nr:ParB-like nuclease domain-containing protein [Lachnospiraceae bacterium]